MPSPYHRIILPCSVIIPIQPIGPVQFLAIILIRLNIRRAGEHSSERIVMIDLFHLSCFIHYHPVVSLMILHKIVEFGIRRSQITVCCQHLGQYSIFIDRVVAVIGGEGSAACDARSPYLDNPRMFPCLS